MLFPDVELLDFAGPFEVFSVASRWSEPPAFHVYTVAEKPGPLVAKNGVSVNPHHLLADCPAPDLLVVPGGLGTRKEMNNEALVGWIGQAAVKAEVVLSVCTGALLLAKAGLLDGLAATTHHGAIDLLRQVAPRTTVREGVRVVDNGKVVTSAGIATGIDAACTSASCSARSRPRKRLSTWSIPGSSRYPDERSSVPRSPALSGRCWRFSVWRWAGRSHPPC